MNISFHGTQKRTNIKPAQAKVQKKAGFLFSSLFFWKRRNQLSWVSLITRLWFDFCRCQR